MTRTEKLARIADFAAGASAFDDVLTLSEAQLTYRPGPDAWSIAEHVVHFVESDIATFHRYRKAIAEPGGPVVGYDEDLFTARLDYHRVPLATALGLLKALRSWAAAHLTTLVDADWTAYTYTHSSQGPVHLEQWITLYIDHVAFHRRYIERNLAAFAAQA